MDNIYKINKDLDFTDETFFELFKNENCTIEKIISTGQVTKEGEWLEENKKEWVILLQGKSEIKFFNGETYKMNAGDYMYIPENAKHRVESTSTNPPCIWLAVHIKSNK
jgi:cupin 2 domain-containing protein